MVGDRDAVEVEALEGEFHQRRRALARVATAPEALAEPGSQRAGTPVPVDAKPGVAGELACAVLALTRSDVVRRPLGVVPLLLTAIDERLRFVDGRVGLPRHVARDLVHLLTPVGVRADPVELLEVDVLVTEAFEHQAIGLDALGEHGSDCSVPEQKRSPPTTHNAL